MSIYRTITFKKGKNKDAQQCLDMLDGLDCERQENGKPLRVLATNEIDGCHTITCRFDDGLDYLAFLAAVGAIKLEVKTTH